MTEIHQPLAEVIAGLEEIVHHTSEHEACTQTDFMALCQDIHESAKQSLAALEAFAGKECAICAGTRQHMASPDDLYMQDLTCPVCKGTGIEKEATIESLAKRFEEQAVHAAELNGGKTYYVWEAGINRSLFDELRGMIDRARHSTFAEKDEGMTLPILPEGWYYRNLSNYNVDDPNDKNFYLTLCDHPKHLDDQKCIYHDSDDKEVRPAVLAAIQQIPKQDGGK